MNPAIKRPRRDRKNGREKKIKAKERLEMARTIPRERKGVLFISPNKIYEFLTLIGFKVNNKKSMLDIPLSIIYLSQLNQPIKLS